MSTENEKRRQSIHSYIMHAVLDFLHTPELYPDQKAVGDKEIISVYSFFFYFYLISYDVDTINAEIRQFALFFKDSGLDEDDIYLSLLRSIDAYAKKIDPVWQRFQASGDGDQLSKSLFEIVLGRKEDPANKLCMWHHVISFTTYMVP